MQVPQKALPHHIQALVPVRDDALVAGFLKQALGDGVKTLLETSEHNKVRGKPVKTPRSMFNLSRSVFGYSLATYKTSSITLRYEGPVEPNGTTQMTIRQHAVHMMGDKCPSMDARVTPYAFQVVEYTQHTAEHHLAGAYNVMATHKAYRDADKETQNAQAAAGGLPHASFAFEPGKHDKKPQVGLKTQFVKRGQDKNAVTIKYHYNNPDFMASTARVFGDPLWSPYKLPQDLSQAEVEHRKRVPQPPDHLNNLWEGIIYISSDECKRLGLAIWNAELAWEMHKLHLNGTEEKKDEEDSVPQFGKENMSNLKLSLISCM